MQIKKDDTVVVIAGKDKGKTGTVLRFRDQAHGRSYRCIQRYVL